MPVLSYVVSMLAYLLFLIMFLEFTRERQGFYKWFFYFILTNISTMVFKPAFMVQMG